MDTPGKYSYIGIYLDTDLMAVYIKWHISNLCRS